jgi:tetratricopeptide (TPR) repeat protein
VKKRSKEKNPQRPTKPKKPARRRRSVAPENHISQRHEKSVEVAALSAEGNGAAASVLTEYDEGSLARAKSHWFFGDWNALAELDLKTLADHPDRDRFALLSASAHQQIGNHDKARQYTRMALQWGCPPKVVAQILVAGVHNTLGRVSALKKDKDLVSKHFHEAVSVFADKKEATLAASARSARELQQLGLLDMFSGQVERQIAEIDVVHGRPTELRERIALLENLLSRVEKNNFGKERTVGQLSGQQPLNQVRFLHSDCAWLKREVTGFLSGDSPAASACVDRIRLKMLGALFSFMKTVNKAENADQSSGELFSFLEEIDSMLLSGTKQEALVGKLNKFEYDPVCLRELLFIRIAELLAISLIMVRDYQTSMRIFSELLCFNRLDEVSERISGTNVGWMVGNYDKELTGNLLDVADVSGLVSFLGSYAEIEQETKAFWYKILGDFYRSRKDNVKAIHYYALTLRNSSDVWLVKQCVEFLVELNQATHAVEMWMTGLFEHLDIPVAEKTVMREVFEKALPTMKPFSDHGHVDLMKFIEEKLPMVRECAGDKKLVLVEIGTTRELVSGQGSTEKLALFCNDRQIHFSTVDMDPVNIDSARGQIKKINGDFELIVAKGEDFLADYEGQIDFIFLDAYDYDHGGHSDARQGRYQKVLGKKISNAACHKMHLDCVMSLVEKLSPWGIIGFDDVWFKDGSWRGKGTTAMPYLLANGFQVIHQGNNVAILLRHSAGA